MRSCTGCMGFVGPTAQTVSTARRGPASKPEGFGRGRADEEDRARGVAEAAVALPQPSPYSDEQLRDIELWQRRRIPSVPTTRPRCSRGSRSIGRPLARGNRSRSWCVSSRSTGRSTVPIASTTSISRPIGSRSSGTASPACRLSKQPPLSVRDIQKQLDFYDPEILAEWEALAGVVECDDLDQRELDRCRRANAAAIRRVEIEARIAELGEPTDRYEVLQDWQRYQEWERAVARIEELKPLASRFERLMELRNDWTALPGARDPLGPRGPRALAVNIAKLEARGGPRPG